jgi:hypothetical protein
MSHQIKNVILVALVILNIATLHYFKAKENIHFTDEHRVQLPHFFNPAFNVANYDSVTYQITRVTSYHGALDTVITETSETTFDAGKYILAGISGVGSETYEDLQRDNEFLEKALKYWKRKYEECNGNYKP